MSAVRNRPRPPVRRPPTSHGRGSFASTSDINGSGQGRPGRCLNSRSTCPMASRCVSWTACAYTFIVTAICECPRISFTTRGRDVGGGQQSRGHVPCVVQSNHPDTGVLGHASEGPVGVPRLDGPVGPGGERVSGLLPGVPGLGPRLSLLHPLPAQGSDADPGQRKGLAAPLALGLVLVGLAPDTLPLGSDPDLPLVEVRSRGGRAKTAGSWRSAARTTELGNCRAESSNSPSPRRPASAAGSWRRQASRPRSTSSPGSTRTSPAASSRWSSAASRRAARSGPRRNPPRSRGSPRRWSPPRCPRSSRSAPWTP